MGLLSSYRKALTPPGIPRVVAALFLCHLPSGMIGFAMLLASQQATGSHAVSGDQAAFPSDSRAMHEAYGATDLTCEVVRGTHFGGPIGPGEPPGYRLAGDRIGRWLADRFALAPPRGKAAAVQRPPTGEAPHAIGSG